MDWLLFNWRDTRDKPHRLVPMVQLRSGASYHLRHYQELPVDLLPICDGLDGYMR